MNCERFLAGQKTYFAGSHQQVAAFGGPSVYFHRECLHEAETSFLSRRHLELLYATLTAWGMHRMGDVDTTKTKLSDWEQFSGSIVASATAVKAFRQSQFLQCSAKEYAETINALRPIYEALKLTTSGATIVVNSKALHHLLPNLVPPIDRQYTIRFFKQPPETWRGGNGKFRLISLPSGLDAQFRLFHSTCIRLKQLADQVDPALFAEQLERHTITSPKALDNAIVNYVRIVGKTVGAATGLVPPSASPLGIP